MSEDKPVYLRNDLQDLRCTHCGGLIGREIEREGKVLLEIGKVELYSMHGWHDCGVVGRVQMHWDSSEVKLRRILRRRKARDCVNEV